MKDETRKDKRYCNMPNKFVQIYCASWRKFK